MFRLKQETSLKLVADNSAGRKCWGCKEYVLGDSVVGPGLVYGYCGNCEHWVRIA